MHLRRFLVPAAAPLIAAGLTVGSAAVGAASPTLADQATVVTTSPAPTRQPGPGTWKPDDHVQCRNHHVWMRWKRYNSTTHRWEYRYRNTGRSC